MEKRLNGGGGDSSSSILDVISSNSECLEDNDVTGVADNFIAILLMTSCIRFVLYSLAVCPFMVVLVLLCLQTTIVIDIEHSFSPHRMIQWCDYS